MNRTTIMLPAQLRARALQEAAHQGVSLGEFIRKALVVLLRHPGASIKADSLFSDKAVFHGNAPKDFAQRHDHYLYGDKGQ